MKDTSKFYITLSGKVNISEQEISSDIAAKIIRLIVPLSANEETDEMSSNTQSTSNNKLQDSNLSAKQFMYQKQAKSDMERIACLAYYLTYYKEMPHFKTSDLTHLNAEAAQPKFSNAAVAVSNSTIQQYLTPSGKGNKQITMRGEALVKALPDRTAVKDSMDKNPLRGNKHKNTKKNKS